MYVRDDEGDFGGDLFAEVDAYVHAMFTPEHMEMRLQEIKMRVRNERTPPRRCFPWGRGRPRSG